MTGMSGYFLATEGEPRVRRARDAVRAGAALVVLLVSAIEAVRLGALQVAITRVVSALPSWADVAFWASYGVAGFYALVVVVAMLVRTKRNPRAARDVILSGALAVVLGILAMRWREGVWPTVLPEIGVEDPEPTFPILRVAVVTAVVVATAPHVARPVRRFGAAMILLATVAGFGLEFGFPSDAIAAIAIGALAAAVILLVFGSPLGFPNVGRVTSTLRALGVGVEHLEPAHDQSWGVRRLRGREAGGALIEVKAYGRDAADTQLAAKLWRSLWYRDTGPGVALTRMQAVEHEALMAMFAERAGVPTTTPIRAGRADDEVAILALRRRGRSLATVVAETLDDPQLVAVWRDVVRLHDADIAHGSLSTATVLVDEHGHYFDDFAAASLAAGDRVNLDVVSLLYSTARLVGVERAVASARNGLGVERLKVALPYFQVPALPRSLRRNDGKPKAVMEELRNAVAEAVAVEPPEPVKLRRVSVGSVLMAALLAFAANALIGQLAAIDYATVWEVVRNAAWVGLLLAYPVAHLSFVPEATGMMAAVGMPLPLRPLVVLQLAARFIGLAVPSAAGRVAMNAAFLVKFGVSRTAAVVQGAIDGVSGFVVEVAILIIALVVSDRSFDLGGDVDFQRILLIVVGLAGLVVLLTLTVAKLRQLVVPVVRAALASVADVVQDPRRLGMVLLSNFLARLVLGVTLWLILRALGVDDVGIAVALIVTIATNLLAGLVPVPGGIGVAEAVLTSWLVLIGVPEASAFAATVMYRMWTFYLPAVEGFIAMRWLEARGYL